jgi:hypothetical protein
VDLNLDCGEASRNLWCDESILNGWHDENWIEKVLVLGQGNLNV